MALSSFKPVLAARFPNLTPDCSAPPGMHFTDMRYHYFFAVRSSTVLTKLESESKKMVVFEGDPAVSLYELLGPLLPSRACFVQMSHLFDSARRENFLLRGPAAGCHQETMPLFNGFTTVVETKLAAAEAGAGKSKSKSKSKPTSKPKSKPKSKSKAAAAPPAAAAAPAPSKLKLSFKMVGNKWTHVPLPQPHAPHDAAGVKFSSNTRTSKALGFNCFRKRFDPGVRQDFELASAPIANAANPLHHGGADGFNETWCQAGNYIALSASDATAVVSSEQNRKEARQKAPGTGLGAIAGDGRGDLSGPLPSVVFVEHGLELPVEVIAAPAVAISLPSPTYRGLSARRALDAYNQEHGGWANREKSVTVGGLLEFVVGHDSNSLSSEVPQPPRDARALQTSHAALVSRKRDTLGLPTSRQNAFVLFCKDFRGSRNPKEPKLKHQAVSRAWEQHKEESGGFSKHAMASALDRERYLREHELWLKEFHRNPAIGRPARSPAAAPLSTAATVPRGGGGGAGAGAGADSDDDEPGGVEDDDESAEVEFLMALYATSPAVGGGRGVGGN